jgi:hypothetical protein
MDDVPILNYTDVIIDNSQGWCVEHGSFGVVTKGTWNNKTVAIKRLLLPSDPSDPAVVASTTRDFEQEAKLHYNLRHENVVKVTRSSSYFSLLQSSIGYAFFTRTRQRSRHVVRVLSRVSFQYGEMNVECVILVFCMKTAEKNCVGWRIHYGMYLRMM